MSTSDHLAITYRSLDDLKPDPRNRVSEALQTLCDFIDVTGQLTFKCNAPPRINDAKRT